MKLENSIILITGGSTGIGQALVNILKKNNQLIICNRHKSKNIEYLEQENYNIKYIRCDLRKEEDIIRAFEQLQKERIKVNILINNAGIIDDVSFFDKTINHASLQDIVSVNLIAPIVLSHFFLKQLPESSHAGIINIGSKTAFIPDSSFLTYSVSKAGLHSFSVCLREQLHASGIELFEIIPPRVDTVMARKVSKKSTESDSMMNPDLCARKIIEAVESNIYEFELTNTIHDEY